MFIVADLVSLMCTVSHYFITPHPIWKPKCEVYVPSIPFARTIAVAFALAWCVSIYFILFALPLTNSTEVTQVAMCMFINIVIPVFNMLKHSIS